LEARCRISPQEQVYCWVAVSEVKGQQETFGRLRAGEIVDHEPP
jgi:hypothetical protein